jgi:hypothetical protein
VGNSSIGEKLIDIRQLAKSTIGEKEDWRWYIGDGILPH